MDTRLILAAAAGAGLAVASAASLLFGGRSQAAAVADLDRRTSLVVVHPVPAEPATGVVRLAETPPLFPVFAGPNAPAELILSLEGIAQSPGRTAALLAIGGKPAEWLSLGETRDGVTLDDVGRSSVTVDTPRGEQTLDLGANAPPVRAAAAAPPPADLSMLPAPAGAESPPQ